MIKQIRLWSITLVGIFTFISSQGQTTDSLLDFTPARYFQLILANHPVIRQADLLSAEAHAYEIKARGAFDPKLLGDFNQKSFDGKEYFSIGEAGFKIPSWYGVEFKGGYQWATGVFLNPENTVPVNGQATLGVSLNLLQGLVIDKRRATLQQARVMPQLNDAKRRSLANDLLLQANEVYWNWVLAHQVVQIFQEASRLATDRLRGTVIGFEQGYKSAMDTLESSIQVQTRQADLQQAQVELWNARLLVSNFLWTPEDEPLEIKEELRPPAWQELTATFIPPDNVDALTSTLSSDHPDLLQYRFELDQLEIERRLKKEMLKPELRVNYNFLGNGWNFSPAQSVDGTGLHDLFLENYKWGLEFRFPIFLRKARGDLEITTLKIQKTSWKREQKELELNNKIQGYFNNLNNYADQIIMYEGMVEDYRRLLSAETDRFALGESSIFILNSREQKLIEAQLKLASLQAKYHKSRLALQGAAGRLVN